MSPEVTVAVIVQVGAVVVLFVQHRLTRAEQRQARAEQAAAAAIIKEKVEPISNGFAAGVKASLARIELTQAEQHADLVEMRDHVTTIETLGNEDRRDMRHTVKNLAAAMSMHIDTGHPKET